MPASAWRGLALCGGFSLAAHIVVLAGWLPVELTSSAGSGRPAAAPAMQVALVSAPQVPPAGLEALASTLKTQSSPEAAAELRNSADRIATSEPANVAAAASSAVPAEALYIPRPLLSVAPVAQQAVLLDWPADAPPAGRYSAVLALFIDEFGVVQRVQVDQGELPEALRQHAAQTFAGIRFSPGKLEGRDVKSRIRIEVSFEASPQVQRRGVGP